MRIGQRVRVKWDGGQGIIAELNSHNALLRMDESDEDGVSEYWESLNEIEPLQQTHQPASQDFDRGFGIGRLSRHADEAPAPTARAIDREVERVAKLRRCPQCRHLEGDAMFTTDPDRRICDDCF